MARVLIVDDDEQMCRLLAKKINRMGHEAEYVMTLGQVLPAAEQVLPDVAFMDVFMPDGNGLEMLAALRNCPSEPEVIIITGMGDPDGAEKAIKSGAWDYVEKGASLEDLVLPLTRALQYRQEKLASRPLVALKREGIVGNSASMQACLDLLAQAAACDANVLISGETGTGKELFAMALHQNSARTGRKFVVVDCAALPETLVESLLFGHEKGSFTGADQTRQGLVAQAHGGTLFLDEVGELPLSMQKSFLRVLQERRFRPVGGQTEIHSDFRLVAATNRDLDLMAAQGGFRSDLLFRLRALQIDLPPLRERREDIKEMALFQLARLCERYGTEVKGFTPDFLQGLLPYSWPGNVRELIAVIEHAIAAAGASPTLFRCHLPEKMRIDLARSAVSTTTRKPEPLPSEAATPVTLPPLKELVKAETQRLELWYLKELLERVGGSLEECCRVSGLCRSVLYEKLRQHGLRRLN
ncbi:MAG: sigma-54 dependent transcriptional regulator [Deltaproteobacteria bacterium]|nr:sigma-54 dependent transcriptional regulator [Deltaproteobacteria bacterium]